MYIDPTPGPPAWYEYNGYRYYRNARVRYYYDPTGNMLHHAVWVDANGPIPPDHHIHHRNHDRGDNRLVNLQLLTAAEHREHHVSLQRLPALPLRPCAVCGVEFQPAAKAPHVLCCSGSCGSKKAAQTRKERGTDKRKPRSVVCKQCGTTFATKAFNAACCSDECREDRARARAGDDPSYDPGRYRQPILKRCAACDGEFEAATNDTVACGVACRRRLNTEQASDSWRDRQPTVWTCQHCGDQFLSRATSALYCTKLCRARARRAQHRTELGL